MMLAKLEATLGRVVSRRLLHILVSTVPLVCCASDSDAGRQRPAIGCRVVDTYTRTHRHKHNRRTFRVSSMVLARVLLCVCDGVTVLRCD